MTVVSAPVTKTIEVDCLPERAFDVFTAQIGSWWPLDSHRLTEGGAADAVFEPREGGRVYEVSPDGTEHDWGEVLAYERPSRVVFTWVLTAEPTEIEVRFTSIDHARTRVDLEHRNWERLGERAEAVRERYLTGWDVVLAPFATRLDG